MSSVYLDVRATRIQAYIGRTSSLQMRRGASSAIREATDLSELVAALAGAVKSNDETYDTEGVAHLIVEHGDPQQVALKVLAHMRTRVPAAHLEATWATADSYSLAYQGIDNKRLSGDQLQWFPNLLDDPVAASCDSCKLAPVQAHTHCADCIRRQELSSRHERFGAEPARYVGNELLHRVSTSRVELNRLPRDLNELARCGHDPLVRKTNHLATVYADGNGIGAIFHRMADDPELARRASEAVTSATWAAAVSATAAITPADGKVMPVEVTVLAADDLTVSVPAASGWPFALQLIRQFDREVRERFALGTDTESGVDGRVKLPDGVGLPSLSVGLLFSHAKQPIDQAIRESFNLLRVAKSAVGGKEAALAWRDLTSDTLAKDQHTNAVTWQVVEDLKGPVNNLATLPAHQRKRLAALLANPGITDERWDDECRRLGLSDLFANFPLHGARAATNLGAADALRMTQWWSPRDGGGDEQ